MSGPPLFLDSVEPLQPQVEVSIGSNCSSRLERRRNSHFFPIQPQFCSLALCSEHRYAVGIFVAGGDLLSPQLICHGPAARADH